MQDIIENAIIRVMTADSNGSTSWGNYMQQFPYPCYTYDEYEIGHGVKSCVSNVQLYLHCNLSIYVVGGIAC